MARALGDRFDPALRKRIASGVVLASVAVGDVVLGGWFFASLVLAAVVLMAVEWARLAPLPDPLAQTVPLTALVAAVPSAAVVAVMAERLELAAVILAMGAIAGGALATVLIRVPMDRTAGGILYLGLPAAALVLLRNDPASGLPNVLWLFAVVWATDVCAYAVGRSIGGPRLAPAISPGKTIAGLLGGMAGAALAGAAVAALAGGPPRGAALVAIILAVVAQAGDLLESHLKRLANVKDSGDLIPGHGGILDRLDGLLFAAPVFALLVHLGVQVAG